MKKWIVFPGLLLAGVLVLVRPAGHRPATTSEPVPPSIAVEPKSPPEHPPDASASVPQAATAVPAQATKLHVTPEATWFAPVPLELSLPDSGDASSQGLAAEPDAHDLLRKLRALAATNFKDAEAAALTLPIGEERNRALEAVCLGLAETSPGSAVQMAMSLHLNDGSSAVVENLVQQWASADAPAALAWAETLSPGQQQNEFAMQIAYALSKIDPVDAARVAVEQIPPGEMQDEAVMSVLNQWANQDLVAAVNWVKTFPAGPLRDRALNELEGISRYRNSLVTR